MSEPEAAGARGERLVVPEVPLADQAPSVRRGLGRRGLRLAAARRCHAFVHRGPGTRAKGKRMCWGSPGRKPASGGRSSPGATGPSHSSPFRPLRECGAKSVPTPCGGWRRGRTPRPSPWHGRLEGLGEAPARRPHARPRTDLDAPCRATPIHSHSPRLGDPWTQDLARCRIGRPIRRRRDRYPPGERRLWESLAPPPANRQSALFGHPRRRRE